VAVSGTWSNVSNEWYYTPGAAATSDIVSTVYEGENPVFDDLDYRARFWSPLSLPSCLVIRGSHWQGSWTDSYEFCYNDTGSYMVSTIVGRTKTVLQPLTLSTAINTGAAWNTLRVRAVGYILTFWINGTQVWSRDDGSRRFGRVGILAYGSGPLWVDDVVLTQVFTPTGEVASDVLNRKPPK
jgi:hypothetical protein